MTDMGYTGQKSLMGLLDYHARFYDPGLARFISADSIVPNPGSSMSWDRFAYVNGNPLSFIDPTGHFITKEPDCTQLSCSGDPAHEPKEDDKGESDDTVGKETNLFSVCIQDLGSCYMGGWYNFGGAWSIYSNPNSSASLRILAGLYMGIWGDAHILAAVGISLATYGTYVAILGETSACAASFPCQQQVANTIDDLIAQARSQYPKLAGIYQYHHIFPKYLGGSSNEGIVMVDAAYHQVITNAFRSLWTYGGGKPALDVAQQIIIEVYSLYPLPPVP
jgi:RHS repeat-associated protein